MIFNNVVLFGGGSSGLRFVSYSMWSNLDGKGYDSISYLPVLCTSLFVLLVDYSEVIWYVADYDFDLLEI